MLASDLIAENKQLREQLKSACNKLMSMNLKPKELTDDEINKTYLEKYDGHMGFLSPDEVKEFARAILRKAQE
jgi:hypothetical protein